MFLTKKYKQGYIHYSYVDGKTLVRCSVNATAYAQQVKSAHAAKILITKFENMHKRSAV